MRWVPFSADKQFRRSSCERGGAAVGALGGGTGSSAAAGAP